MHAQDEPRKGEVATFLTIPQAAHRAGVSSDTIRRRIKDGVLPAVRDAAGRYRITPEDAEALVKAA